MNTETIVRNCNRFNICPLGAAIYNSDSYSDYPSSRYASEYLGISRTRAGEIAHLWDQGEKSASVNLAIKTGLKPQMVKNLHEKQKLYSRFTY